MIPFINEIDKNNAALYLNFPFCTNPCSYCHYVKNISFGYNIIPDTYFGKLCSQLDELCSKLENIRFKSIYFGGGTPSLLSDNQLKTIENIFIKYNIHSDEVSMELHPSNCNFNFSENKMITRYSVAVQSFDENILSSYKRKGYSNSDITRIVSLLRENNSGVKINIDLIFDDYIPLDSFKYINNLKPDTVTMYPNTKGRGVNRLINIKNTFLQISNALTDYIPLAKSKFIYLLKSSEQSEYSKIEYESFGDIIGIGHNSVSYIKDSTYLTLYDDNIIVKERTSHGSRLITALLASLPIGVTYKSVCDIMPELIHGHYLFTVDSERDINEKHSRIDENTLVYLPESEYIRFIYTVLFDLYNDYSKVFLSAIGFGDNDFNTISTVYNEQIIIPYKEKKEIQQLICSETISKLSIPDKFILVEGIDGSGKDTFVNLFINELKKRFKYESTRSISVLGQPDSSLPFGNEAKDFIENLNYSDRKSVVDALTINRIESEKKIKKMPGIKILIRGIVTDLATFNYVFDDINEHLGENTVISTWDYYIVINTDIYIADKRIEERGIPRTWREDVHHLSYFSDFFMKHGASSFRHKLIVENTSLFELREKARKLADEIYAEQFKRAD